MKRRRWSTESVLKHLKDLSNRGVPINTAYVNRHHNSFYAITRYYFGSWKAALTAAGVSVTPPRRWTREELVKILRRLKDPNGFLGTSRINQESRRIGRDIRSGIRRQFGSLREAKEELA